MVFAHLRIDCSFEFASSHNLTLTNIGIDSPNLNLYNIEKAIHVLNGKDSKEYEMVQWNEYE